MKFNHLPVLLKETIELLRINPDGTYVDGTLGGGGHSLEIARRLSDKGRLIGIDQDPEALAAAQKRLGKYEPKVTFVNSNFSNLDNILSGLGIEKIDGILLDIGVSSYQLDQEERGFSYRHDAPLDMRMNRLQGKTAADLVNKLPERELAHIISAYGEERWAKRIARRIVEQRSKKPITTTGELVEVIKSAMPHHAKQEKQHPAKRSFQALRIAVNNELEALEQGLRSGISRLNPGGRICVISFHSLEDRIVKTIFQQYAQPCQCPPDLPVCICGRNPELAVVTRKPVTPGNDEIKANPRARSAKLRAAEKLGVSSKK